jgi:hypothetical protein
MITSLSPACKCGTKLARCHASDHATHVHDRTCRRCHSKWRVIVRPNISRRAGVAMHPIELTAY